MALNNVTVREYMNSFMRICCRVVLVMCFPPFTQLSAQDATPRFEVPDTRGMHWFKGNTHTHTLESDGDSPPEVVARWYKRNGYNFLVISDHNVRVDPARLGHLVDSAFILISGEELSTTFGGKPVHINGLNIPHVIEPRTDTTLLGTVQKNVDAVREVDGVPHINHPNFRWTLSAEILAQVKNDKLLEIFNGHPLVHNHGGGGMPGMEEVWDILLTGGKRIYGIAVDDAHHFEGEFAHDRSNPGRGWVMVKAAHLDARAILGSMEDGLFYASTGVVLEDVVIQPNYVEVRIRQKGDFRYTTEFIGDGGEVLLRTGGNPAVFSLGVAPSAHRSRSYVRARVVDSGGAVAWVQPVFLVR
jgi:hypothetical protein